MRLQWHLPCRYLLFHQFDIVFKEVGAWDPTSTRHFTKVFLLIYDFGALWERGLHSAGHCGVGTTWMVYGADRCGYCRTALALRNVAPLDGLIVDRAF